MKHKLLLKSLILLCALITGSGTSWATDVTTTFKNKTSGTWAQNLNLPCEDGGLTWASSATPYGWDTSRGIQYSKVSTDITTTITNASVTKVVIVASTNGTANANSLSVYVGSTQMGSTQNMPKENNKTYTFQNNNGLSGEIKVTMYNATGDTGKSTYIKSIAVTYTTGGGSTTFNVTYDDNGATSGDVPTDDNEYEAGDVVTVLGNTGNLGKEHYTFAGWNTEDDGTGDHYDADDTFEIAGTTTLYAEWTANTHTVTLPSADTYGAYGMNAINPVAYDTEVTLTYTPDSGYENYVATWSVNGEEITGNTFSMPDEDVTVTVAVAEPVDYATLPFSWAGGVLSGFNALTGTSYSLNDTGSYAESHGTYRIKFTKTGDYLQVKTDSQPGKVTIGVKMIGGTSTSKITVQESETGNTNDWNDVEELTISGNSTSTTLSLETSNAFASTTRYVRLYFTKGSNVGVGSIGIAKPTPTITTGSSSLTGFTYVESNGPSAAQTVSVSGSNLTANIGLSLDDNSYFEISTSQNNSYGSSLSLTQSNGIVASTNIYVRLKAGLGKAANYEGTLTLTSTGATDKTVSLSGSVTGQTYAITVDENITGGTIEANTTSAEAGTTISLTATPDEHYTFASWSVYKTDDQSTTVSVSNNQFTMPAYPVIVTATFTEDPKHTATFYVQGVVQGTDANVYEGEAITFPNVSAPIGYTFRGWTNAAINGEQNSAPATLVSSANMGSSDVNYYAVFAIVNGSSTTATLTASHTTNSTTYNTTPRTYTDDKGNTWTAINNEPYEDEVARYGLNGSNRYFSSPTFADNITSIVIMTYNGSQNDRTFYINSEIGTEMGDLGTVAAPANTKLTEEQTATLGETPFKQFILQVSGALGFSYIKVTYGSQTISNYCTTVPTTGTITLNSACHDGNTIYGTYYTNRAYVMPATLKGSVVSVDDDGKLAVDAVYDGSNNDVVPANVALLISTIDEFNGTKDYNITYSTGGDDYSEYNMLKGTLTADDTTEGTDCLFYRLTMHKPNTLNKIGFWWGATNGGAFKPGAHKAYLAVPQAQAQEMNQVQGFSLFDDGATTAIYALNDERESLNDGAIYDLSGRRITNGQSSMVNVQSLPKGIYVQNGKKFIVK